MTGEFALAVHALVYLNHKASILSSEELAKNVCTNPARVRKVMAKLKKAGLVSTKEGAQGGYFFELSPEDITLCRVKKALGEPLVSAAWRSGSVDMKCLIASGMADIMEGIYEKMDLACEEELKKTSIADIDHAILKEKRSIPHGKI